MVNGYRDSDSLIVSGKPSNKACDNKRATGRVERRRLAEGNSSKRNRGQTQGWITLPNELDRVRQAAQRRRERGAGKPETFTFLGFTHICGRSRKGKFMVLRKTDSDRMRSKVQEIKKILRERMHWSIPDVGRWLKLVLTGNYQYYGVPWNGRMLSRFRWIVIRLWCRTLRRRSQKHRITWKRMYTIAEQWLPKPFICHPYPLERLCVNTRSRSPVH